MRRAPLILLYLFFSFVASAQGVQTPDKIYGQLFADVQMSRIFPDNKTFVDCIPKRNPKDIVDDYVRIKNNPNLRFSLKLFVEQNFHLPDTSRSTYVTQEKDLEQHIQNLWEVLKRYPKTADTCQMDAWWCDGSLLNLPYAYIVPGGRFREIYYWDSYFTMLGLKESKEYDLIENMVKNFAYLISEYGHIPNGNRSYYLSRSQPPYFSLMIDLLAEIKGKEVYVLYQPALEKEYNYWMDKTDYTRHLVKMQDGSFLNRYWDQWTVPRQESYFEDKKVANMQKLYPESEALLFRNLRTGAESGWDFSSRWFRDGKNLFTVQTTSIVPVDLNCLLYHLEQTLSNSYSLSGNNVKSSYFSKIAGQRRKSIQKYCWSTSFNWYVDYNLSTKEQSPYLSLAGMYPFFLDLSDKEKFSKAKSVLEKKFLKYGGVTTTLVQTGQQWDAPNGWAPLQWVSIIGAENYGDQTLAAKIAGRWFSLNKKVFLETGKLMEKYDVINQNKPAGGGEYASQDGFGWTNGVLLALMKKYNLK